MIVILHIKNYLEYEISATKHAFAVKSKVKIKEYKIFLKAHTKKTYKILRKIDNLDTELTM